MLLHPLRLLRAAAGSLICYTISCAKQKSSPFFPFFRLLFRFGGKMPEDVFFRACGWPPERENTPGSPVSVFSVSVFFSGVHDRTAVTKEADCVHETKDSSGRRRCPHETICLKSTVFFCCKRLILQYFNSWHASCLTEAGILKTHQINHQKQRSRDYAGHSENDRKDT